MPIITEATYEDGVLKVAHPLPLDEHARVQVTIDPVSVMLEKDPLDSDPLKEVIGICDGPTDAAENHDRYLYGPGEARPS